MLSKRNSKPSSFKKRKRGRRPSINVAFKVRVFTSDGDSWVEERCWRCGRVLNRHHVILSTPIKEETPCPSCRAINKVEREK